VAAGSAATTTDVDAHQPPGKMPSVQPPDVSGTVISKPPFALPIVATYRYGVITVDGVRHVGRLT
jgi:hypothetical protein